MLAQAGVLVECYYCKGVHSVHISLTQVKISSQRTQPKYSWAGFRLTRCKVTFFRLVDNLTNVVDPHWNKRAFQPLAPANVA